jgi:hypothetical protein
MQQYGWMKNENSIQTPETVVCIFEIFFSPHNDEWKREQKDLNKNYCLPNTQMEIIL